jgi:GNAT superfamily N-acetyltransferase
VRAAPADAAVRHGIPQRAFAAEARLSGQPDIPPRLEDIEAIRADIRTQTVLKAVEGEHIIGAARGLRSGNECRIRAVCVEPSRRGRGIGASLLRAVEERHPDVERFVLTTNTLVPGNVSFYERRGCHVVELTPFTDRIGLAPMCKPVRARHS